MSKPRIILGIQEAHDASAALMVGGAIVAAAQEERFTGLKGDYGYPEHAINACLSAAGVDAKDIDEVALASHRWNPVLTRVKRNANFSVDDWVAEQELYWKPTLLEGQRVCYHDLFKDRPNFSYDDSYPMGHLLGGYMDQAEMDEMREIRLRTVAERLGVPRDAVRTIRHEDCHHFYAYFGSPFRGEVLSLTAEGIGDYSNGTVSVMSERGRREVSHTTENHIGHLYQYATLLMGMKPAQHEYKVMGMAPYANIKEVEKSYAVYRDILKVDGLDIVYDQKPPDLYFHFRDALHGHRFDGIAGAIQLMTERLLCDWLTNCLGEGLPGRVVFSGGVAQNIKACQKMAAMEGVASMFICPAAGDTSLPIGACYYAAWEHATEHGGDPGAIEPLATPYLGPEHGDDEVDRFLQEDRTAERHDVEENPTPERIATLLASGDILARSCGRMEFGMRALGNRSILADPRNPGTVRKINDAIKFRDFWMPFTPSVLAERAGDYLVNPKSLPGPFMTMAFDSTAEAQRDLPAALHPADLTGRPQILERRHNPGYYDIIKAFEAQTGVGAVLNTSFNLHGDPIASGPREAVYTLDNSDLDGLVLGNRLIRRRR